ncbi:MAG: glutathione S-transferase N-terminal domain-containing protein [Pseudomonadota bacterium]
MPWQTTVLRLLREKVRLVLDHLHQDYILVDVGNVGRSERQDFADNPLMSVPVLKHGEHMLLDSDHIASYLVRSFDPADRFDVLTSDAKTLNARAILNGAMAAEVRLVLAARSGLETTAVPFFDKSRSVIRHALDWCEAEHSFFAPLSKSYAQFHFISFWDHVHHYGLIEGRWPHLQTIADELAEDALIARSSIPN